MFAQFFSIGLLVLLSAMLPGPDFALVTKNTVLHSRRAGFFTSLGISSACLVHVTYCMLGLAILISESLWLFNLIKYLGAAYLIYLGIVSLRSHTSSKITLNTHKKSGLSNFSAFRQGFLCNLLNPKATLFFLALFTVIINVDNLGPWKLVLPVELFLIITAWFFGLTLVLSHPRVLNYLGKMEQYISKILGVFLIGFGLVLTFARK